MTDKTLLKALHYLSKFSHTGNLHVHSSLCNNVLPRQLYFTKHGMVSGTMILLLNHKQDPELNSKLENDIAVYKIKRNEVNICLTKAKSKYYQIYWMKIFDRRTDSGK